MSTKKILLLLGISTFVLIMAMLPVKNEVYAFHTADEIVYFKSHLDQSHSMGPLTPDQIFPTATQCSGCHGYDMAQFASVDANGNDVNVHDDWQSSMMANSAKDPFWRAKVSHEILVNPGLSEEIQTKCTSCHAPMGHYNARYKGFDHYTINDMLQDTIGLDGVSCGACHQIKNEDLGITFSGEINFDTTRVAYGPYENPFAAIMSNFVGMTPVYSEHINDAGVCAPCHSLVTETLDLDGQPTGETFIEQATYHEWLNSVYNEAVSCQQCHMPRIDDTVVISANYLFLEGRSPYGLHELVGGNTFMLKLMKDYRLELDIPAKAESFDASIAATFKMLQQQTLDFELDFEAVVSDTAFFKVQLKNKAGHKFPTGYPSRRAVVQFVVLSEIGDTIFQSGMYDDTYEVAGQDPYYEEHYDVINSEDQVQIYEIVNGDVEQNFTTVLERADVALKDNRLPPVGFSTTHEVYDTTMIIGNALTDANFNKDDAGVEGSGADILRYHIPLNFYTGELTVMASVYYQSLPPKWMKEMFEASTPEIDLFKSMFDGADQSPVLIAADTLNNLFVSSVGTAEPDWAAQIQLYPNPSKDQALQIALPLNLKLKTLKVFSVDGRLLQTHQSLPTQLDLPEQSGIFILQFETDQGVINKRWIRL